MKRLWLGIGILAAVLALGLGLTFGMDAIHSQISDGMTQAAQAALGEDWDTAQAQAGNAQQSWERWRHFVAAFADHEPLEEMDRLFAELSVYRAQGLVPEYAAVCLCLARQAEAIGESHSFNWWHLL